MKLGIIAMAGVLLAACGPEGTPEQADNQGDPQQQPGAEQQLAQADHQDGDTDEYGRTPDHDHYGHNHPPLDDQQQQQQQIQQQQAGDADDQETDQYGRTPDDDHYGHNHPPLDQEQQQPSGEIGQQQEQTADEGGPQIAFDKEVHDFGTIPNNTEVSTKFEFTNTGDEALVIQNVQAGCGCTAPSYSEEPVAPGEKGFIEVEYDSGFRDVPQFSQSVTVQANTAQGTHRVTVQGQIE